MPKQTYEQGFRFKTTCSLTKGELISICDNLSAKWGVRVTPAKFCEGGLEVDVGVGHKSMRFSHMCKGWPWIPTELDPKKDEDIVLSNMLGTRVFFKAFHGAPVWTADEIEDIRMAFLFA